MPAKRFLCKFNGIYGPGEPGGIIQIVHQRNDSGLVRHGNIESLYPCPDELGEALRKALGRLKARERRAIELWLDGMSVRAIANELKTTVGAVKMLKFRTILKLKKMMSEYCHDQ